MRHLKMEKHKLNVKGLVKKAVVISGALIAMAGPAMAQGLDATSATTGIATASGYATTVLASGLGLGVIFLIGRVLRRGMRSAG